MLQKVLLATDGSKDAALAARAAVDVCHGTGADLHVVHVWYAVPTACLRPFMREELKKLGNELLEEGVKQVEDSGGLVSGAHLLEGGAADEIRRLGGCQGSRRPRGFSLRAPRRAGPGATRLPAVARG